MINKNFFGKQKEKWILKVGNYQIIKKQEII